MQFTIDTPTRAYLTGTYTSDDVEGLKKDLTYTNENAAHDVKRHYNNKWLRRKDEDSWQRKLDEMKKKVKNTLVFSENGRLYIRPSSLVYLNPLKYTYDRPKYNFPIPKKLPWAHMLPFELHPYQELSVEKLIAIRHGNVELCTGAGKSAILLKICRETGFRAAIVAPSESIFSELVEAFEYYLGKGNVGTFGDGKKKIDKRITICIGDSLSNIVKGSPEWEFFSNLDMLCVDESHTWGAETLENLCHGIFAEVPYRFFMSGTQTRGDGTELLLHSIIGPTVHRLTTEEAIKGGYICYHDFAIVELESSNPNYNSNNPLEEKRIHFLNNKNITAFIAKMCNLTQTGQVLVLVEELSQIAALTKLLKVPYAYAHSCKLNKTLIELGLDKVVKKESVEKFNKNEVKILIGTSCIATGTNIYPMRHTFNWVGSSSEIKAKQGAVGRSVRLGKQNPYKEKCAPKEEVTVWDFDVRDIPSMSHSLQVREDYYRDSGTTIRRINLNAQKVQTGGIR